MRDPIIIKLFFFRGGRWVGAIESMIVSVFSQELQGEARVFFCFLLGDKRDLIGHLGIKLCPEASVLPFLFFV